jgi:hypothetical protein
MLKRRKPHGKLKHHHQNQRKLKTASRTQHGKDQQSQRKKRTCRKINKRAKNYLDGTDKNHWLAILTLLAITFA